MALIVGNDGIGRAAEVDDETFVRLGHGIAKDRNNECAGGLAGGEEEGAAGADVVRRLGGGAVGGGVVDGDHLAARSAQGNGEHGIDGTRIALRHRHIVNRQAGQRVVVRYRAQTLAIQHCGIHHVGDVDEEVLGRLVEQVAKDQNRKGVGAAACRDRLAGKAAGTVVDARRGRTVGRGDVKRNTARARWRAEADGEAEAGRARVAFAERDIVDGEIGQCADGEGEAFELEMATNAGAAVGHTDRDRVVARRVGRGAADHATAGDTDASGKTAGFQQTAVRRNTAGDGQRLRERGTLGRGRRSRADRQRRRVDRAAVALVGELRGRQGRIGRADGEAVAAALGGGAADDAAAAQGQAERQGAALQGVVVGREAAARGQRLRERRAGAHRRQAGRAHRDRRSRRLDGDGDSDVVAVVVEHHEGIGATTSGGRPVVVVVIGFDGRRVARRCSAVGRRGGYDTQPEELAGRQIDVDRAAPSHRRGAIGAASIG